MLSIGAFSKISNVTTKTLRFYDEIGLLKPVYVDDGSGYRYYDVGQLKTILLINKLKGYCFSLEEIASVLQKQDNQYLLSLIRQKETQIYSKIEEYQFILGQIAKDMTNLERGISIMAYLDEIEIKLTETQQKNILSIRQKINMEDYGKYLGKLFETVAKEKLTPVGQPMSIYHDEEFNPESYDTEIAVPIKEVVTGTRDFPGMLCAMAIHKGPYSGLTSVYSKLKEWTEAQGFVLNGAPFDIYLTNPGECKPEDYVTEVYFPLKKQ